MANRIILVLVALILFLAYFVLKPAQNNPALETNSQTPTQAVQPNISQEKLKIDISKTYQAVLSTTAGEITIDLTAKETPMTVDNFVTLARKNFYNQIIFHRVIKGFMIQGGDPLGNGTGGPGYTFSDEPFSGEYLRGTVAMANSGPNSNGSQFFIIQQDNPNLPKQYVIFGQVSSGIEAVDKIAEGQVKPNSSGENSVPVNPVIIKEVQIIEQ